MDDEVFYNYFPTDTGPTDYGETVTLDPFVVNAGSDTGGSIEDGVTFDNDFGFDNSGAVDLSSSDETLGSWWDSFVSGISSGLNKPSTQKPATGSSGSSGGSSSSNNKTTTSTQSLISTNTGITPVVLIAMGALLLAAVYIGRTTK